MGGVEIYTSILYVVPCSALTSLLKWLCITQSITATRDILAQGVRAARAPPHSLQFERVHHIIAKQNSRKLTVADLGFI